MDAIPLSELSNIIVHPDQTAKISYVPEPERSWSYYFAKAELSRQQEDWDQVIQLIEEARSLGYEPEDPLEWLTYIEAQALTGNMEAAERLSRDVFRQENGTRRGLCQLWNRLQVQGSIDIEGEPHVDQLVSDFECVQVDG